MAKRNSFGCGTIIIALIALATAAKYWYILVAIGFVALAIWGVIKAIKSRSIEIGNTDTPIERHFDNGDAMVTDSLSGLSRPIETSNTDTPIAKHFVDNGDGTVTDSLTGLSWMRCAMGQTWDGIVCRGVATLYTWKQAKALPYSFAGRNDWRLPTCDELKSIIEPQQKRPAINTDIFPQTTSLDFWSSSPHTKDSIHAWIVDFNVGETYLSNRIIGRCVRLVRGGQNIGWADQIHTEPCLSGISVPVSTTTITVSEVPESAKIPNPVAADTVSRLKTADHFGTALTDTEMQLGLGTIMMDVQERVHQVNAEIERILATERAAAAAVSAAEKADAEVVVTIKMAEEKEQVIKRLLSVLINIKTHRILDAEKSVLQERVSLINAMVEKDPTKKKAAAEVAIKIIDRLKTSLDDDTEIQMILNAKKAAMLERVAQVDAEIEQILAAEKAAKSVMDTADKAAAEVAIKQETTKKAAIREQVAQVNAEIQRILANEKAAGFADAVATGKTAAAEAIAIKKAKEDREHFINAQVDAEIERILTAEKPAALVVAEPEKSPTEAALKQEIVESRERIDDLFEILVPVETQWILDSENIGMPEHIAQENAEIHQLLATERTNTITGRERTQQYGVTHVAASNLVFPSFYGLMPPPPAVKMPEVTQIIDSEVATDFDFFEKELTEAVKQYDFVLVNKLEQLKTRDQWFEERTQKRRLKTDSVKVYAWLLPFMPLEVARLCDLKPIVNWGLNSVSVIPKQLRVLIRERRKIKEPYDDLLCALYSSCILTDFVKTLAFDGPANKVACNVDIQELLNIHINYSTMGYHYIESLLKTDIKWLLEAFGEPSTHQSFDALWPNIRQNAVSRYFWEELRIANEAACSYRRTERSMVEWLRNRVSSNLRYYREGWERRNEWLGRNDEWLKQKVAREAPLAASPVAVKTPGIIKERRYSIPTPPKPTHRFSLDMSSIETKLAETVAVSAILKDIFAEDVPVPPQTAVPDSTAPEVSIAGLDAESFTFMQALASKHIWARDELEKLAADHSLMLDGTLDSINDASYDHFGGPFFEGDDPIEINPEFAKEISV